MKTSINVYQQILFAAFLSLGLLLTSCGGDSSTGPGNGGGNGNGNGNGNGEPLDPTFSNVQNILNSNCSNCHIGNRESGVRLDSYDNVMNSNGNQYGGPIVVAGEPDNSPLVDKIEPSPEHGAQMPQGRTPLSDDEISLIRDWIDEGAQDN